VLSCLLVKHTDHSLCELLSKLCSEVTSSPTEHATRTCPQHLQYASNDDRFFTSSVRVYMFVPTPSFLTAMMTSPRERKNRRDEDAEKWEI
jgi:hypothetical protein